MSFWEKAGNFAVKANEYMEKEQERLNSKLRSKLRTMTDEQIRNGLININPTDWRYDIVAEEAKRRGI